MTGPDRPRVLFLTPRFPYPPDRGDRLHAYHLLRVFRERFDLTLATFAPAGEAERRGEELFADWGLRLVTAAHPLPGRLGRLARGLVQGDPLQVAYYDEPALHRELARLGAAEPPFDAVVCHLIRMLPFLNSAAGRVKVVSLCDSIAMGLQRRLRHAPLPERPSVWLEAGRVRRLEAAVMGLVDEGWLVSEVDREEFPGDRSRLRVIPNGVEESLLEGEIPQEPPGIVGFHGHFGVPHNVQAAVTLAHEVLPELRRRGLPARVRLTGSGAAPAVRALSGLPDVELVGYRADLRQALQEYRVLCVPLRFSSGLQNKLVEAMAAGVPVVSSTAAVGALGPGAERWARAAETPAEYAQAIAELWERSPAARARLEEARAWVRARFRWEAYAERLAELVARA